LRRSLTKEAILQVHNKRVKRGGEYGAESNERLEGKEVKNYLT